MNPIYRIKNWPRHFENHESKRLLHARWVPFPNKHDGKSYRRLMARPNGICLFGAWVLIVEVASKMPERGLLVDQDGDPLTAEDLCAKTGAPVEVFVEALEVLSSPKIGWIEQADAGSFPHVNLPLEGKGKTEHRREEQGRPAAPRQPIPRRVTPEIEPPFSSPAFMEALGTYKAVRLAMKRKLTTESELLLYDDLREWGEDGATKALVGAAKAGHLQVLHPDSYRNNGNGNGTYSNSRNARVGASEAKGVDGAVWERSRRA